MKRYILGLMLIGCLTFGGCGWLDGNYVSVTPHRQQTGTVSNQIVEANNYLQLRTALEDMVSSGIESQVISMGDFGQEQLDKNLEMAMRHIKNTYPLGAYAVETISYELGTSGGVTAVAVEVTYLHDRAELRNIQSAANMAEAEAQIADALIQYNPSLVISIEDYEATDIAQLVADFALNNPSLVMETPEVTEQTYPNSGRERILELKFSYQSSREVLRSMQGQVQRVFDSAALYVTSEASDSQKFSQLYAFLMERFTDYQIKTSITPAYSLLSHGVGDSRSFAMIYSEMCRKAGLECQIVVGTRNGEPWFWNMVRDGEYYYHVDLLASRETGSFREQTDAAMANYVWDYSSYPACTGAPAVVPEETTIPSETEPTAEDEKNLEKNDN